MAGEKAPATFESSQSKLTTLLGLSAVERVDLQDAVSELEATGTETVKRDPRNLGHFAQWMVYALDGVDHLNANGKVHPPLEDSAIADLQTKRSTYKNFVDASNNSADESAEKPAQPERTSDRKS